MRDVIVIGAGGGGPIVAKELAARGLDVLLLEAGPNETKVDEQWTHFEADANSGAGFQRWGPADRTKAPWRRETRLLTAVAVPATTAVLATPLSSPGISWLPFFLRVGLRRPRRRRGPR